MRRAALLAATVAATLTVSHTAQPDVNVCHSHADHDCLWVDGTAHWAH